MMDGVATCDWGRAWPSRSRTQGGLIAALMSIRFAQAATLLVISA
jgi:hypothetical protein